MENTLHQFQQGLWLGIMFSAPPLIAATIFGVAVSLLQAVTQVQDQTLPYVVKLVAVAVTLGLMGRWVGVELVRLAEIGFSMVPYVAR
jgi:type III secretion protein S